MSRAPCGRSHEHRFAALICDPAQPDMSAKVPARFKARIAEPAVIATLMKLSSEQAEFFRSHECRRTEAARRAKVVQGAAAVLR